MSENLCSGRKCKRVLNSNQQFYIDYKFSTMNYNSNENSYRSIRFLIN